VAGPLEVLLRELGPRVCIAGAVVAEGPPVRLRGRSREAGPRCPRRFLRSAVPPWPRVRGVQPRLARACAPTPAEKIARVCRRRRARWARAARYRRRACRVRAGARASKGSCGMRGKARRRHCPRLARPYPRSTRRDRKPEGVEENVINQPAGRRQVPSPRPRLRPGACSVGGYPDDDQRFEGDGWNTGRSSPPLRLARRSSLSSNSSRRRRSEQPSPGYRKPLRRPGLGSQRIRGSRGLPG